MKVCLISSRFPLPGESPSIGPESVVFNLVKALVSSRTKISIDIITIRDDINSYLNNLLLPNVIVHYYPSLKFLPRSLGDPLIVKKVISNYKFDLIHSHHPIALSEILHLKAPKIITLHGIYWKERATSDNLTLNIGYYDYNTYTFKKMLSKIDGFVAISPYVVDELNDLNLCGYFKIYQINNPIDNSFFNVQKTDQDNILFYPGTINERKNQIAIINAVKLMKGRDSIPKLILTGGYDKSYFKKVTSKIEENGLNNVVFYKGKVSMNEILDLYGKTSLVYLLSKQETQPMTILEAMATGNPVIASNIKSNSYLVKEGITGYLVDPSDAKKIAECTNELLNNKEKRITMGKSAREIAKKMYSSDTIAAQTLEMYCEVLSINRGR